MRQISVPVLLLAMLVACGRDAPPEVTETQPVSSRTLALESITGVEIRGHMEVLAADAMQGREAGTADYDKAAQYVADQFRQTGLLPMGADSGFFQKIGFFETRLEPDSAEFILHSGDSDVELTFRPADLEVSG